ncbi:MAG: hypothetical protein ACK4MG_02050 [Aquabacterium sp.]
MQPETLKLLASEIVNQTILGNWAYWAVLGCLAIILSASGAFLGAYMRKRAEHAAVQADFDALKKQLHETTALSESIKSDIKHLAERSEKIRWLKQEKLEAYVMHALEISDYYSADMYHRFFDAEPPKGGDPWKIASMLQTLYLPELAAEHAALSRSLSEFQSYIAQGMQQRLDMWRTSGIKGAPTESHCQMFSNHITNINATILNLQASAQKMATELTKV